MYLRPHKRTERPLKNFQKKQKESLSDSSLLFQIFCISELSNISSIIARGKHENLKVALLTKELFVFSIVNNDGKD